MLSLNASNAKKHQSAKWAPRLPPAVQRPKRLTVSLIFSDRRRVYESAGHRIRFIGHEGISEVPFLVEVDALSEVERRVAGTEAEFLAAFDAARDVVHDVAREAYSYGRKTLYVLRPSDFR